MKGTVLALGLGALVFVSRPALADTEGAAADPVAEEARARYRRGIELFDDGDYRLALVELERAYAILPNYKILYNIAQLHLQLAEYAKARVALERYLADGGDDIPASRRAEVERDLATAKKRIATISIEVNVPADVTINDQPVGAAPIKDAMVDAGTLRVQAQRAGYATQTRVIQLAGGDVNVIRLELVRVTQDIVVSSPSEGLSGVAVASWIATGLLTAGAIGTGIAANASASRYESKRTSPIQGSPDEAASDLERQRTLTTRLAVATDVLAGAAIVAAGVSLYFTFKKNPKPEAPRVRVQATGASFAMGF